MMEPKYTQVVNIKFKADAFFDAVVKMTDHQIKKFKKAIGNRGEIGGNEEKAKGWIRFLSENSDFDYMDTVMTDIEEITIEDATTKYNLP